MTQSLIPHLFHDVPDSPRTETALYYADGKMLGLSHAPPAAPDASVGRCSVDDLLTALEDAEHRAADAERRLAIAQGVAMRALAVIRGARSILSEDDEDTVVVDVPGTAMVPAELVENWLDAVEAVRDAESSGEWTVPYALLVQLDHDERALKRAVRK
jgi:hypothetical protein